jgi:cholesterol oxidase
MTAMPEPTPEFDYIVIGSGFGGSVCAHRLTEKGYRVAVIEMGRRWNAANLPKTNWNLRRWFWRPNLGLRGFFNIQWFRHVAVLHGCAVGGGSITYACTLLRPNDSVWERGTWAGIADWKAEMPAHYAAAERMLGVVENRVLGPADRLLKVAADRAGFGGTFYRTRVSIFEGPEGDPGGVTHPDPYFGGAGPDRATCTGCGGCMMGCRYNAKNTLDKNYLYLAEKGGARVFEETRVIDVSPLNDSADGSGGYLVRTVPSTTRLPRAQTFTAGSVIFAASALGTMDLLFQLKRRGSLPQISDQLGNRVRTNAESLIGIRIPHSADDLSKGTAIGSGIYIDEHTHIEATRYPAGSDALGPLATLLAGGRPGWNRILTWMRVVARALVRHPLRTVRCLHPFGFARETLIFLCMQTTEGHIEMRSGRPWYWPFKHSLYSRGRRVPAYIPRANDFARDSAALVGGTAMSMVSEILFDIPGTAHVLGGCPIGRNPLEGVIDHRHRVFGYRNLYICDGSAIAANLGVNPSLTIAALAERAMSYIPPKAAITSPQYSSRN